MTDLGWSHTQVLVERRHSQKAQHGIKYSTRRVMQTSQKLLDFLSQLLNDGCMEEVISKNFEIIKKFSHKSKVKSYRPYSYNTALYHALQQAYVIR